MVTGGSYGAGTTMHTLTCPNCGNEIPLENAVTHQIREELQREFQIDSAKREKAMVEREMRLASIQADLTNRSETLEQEIERRVNACSAEVRRMARKQAETTFVLQMQDLRAQLGEKDQKLLEAMNAELELRKRQRELDSKQQTLELEVARKLDEEREKIRREATSTAVEDQRLRLSEKDQLISGLQAQIEVLRQKAEQGSQQLQGEVLELELETLLKEKFLSDEIVPISKGVRGADLLHRIKTASGLECGTIIWETKRARNWSSTWIAKLKQDQREQKAEIAVLLTQTLPDGVRSFQFVDGIWVTDEASAIGISNCSAPRPGFDGQFPPSNKRQDQQDGARLRVPDRDRIPSES